MRKILLLLALFPTLVQAELRQIDKGVWVNPAAVISVRATKSQRPQVEIILSQGATTKTITLDAPAGDEHVHGMVSEIAQALSAPSRPPPCECRELGKIEGAAVYYVRTQEGEELTAAPDLSMTYRQGLCSRSTDWVEVTESGQTERRINVRYIEEMRFHEAAL